MSLPRYAVARLTRQTYVRFQLDHDTATARALNAGPQEAVHSSANGNWVLGQIEPFDEVQALGLLPGLRLRLMGAPFNTLVVYDIAETALKEAVCRATSRRLVRS